MYSYGQVINGVSRYIDTEIVNKMSGYQKWVIGAGAGIFLNKGTKIFENIKNNEIVKSMEIIDSEDNIDVDCIYQELKKQASKGAITFDLPMIGAITLNETDVDKLYSYIKN